MFFQEYLPDRVRVNPMPMITSSESTDRTDNTVCPLADHRTVTAFSNINKAEIV